MDAEGRRNRQAMSMKQALDREREQRNSTKSLSTSNRILIARFEKVYSLHRIE